MGSLIKPEIYAKIVEEKMKGKMILTNWADEVGVLTGSVGETVIFPKWNTIGKATELTKGKDIPLEELTQDESCKATIKQFCAPGVLIYDIDNLTALGDSIEEGARQQGVSLARKKDTALMEECLTSKLKVKTASKTEITSEELNKGFQMFGDEQDVNDFHGILVNSLVASSFYKMPEFVKADYTYNGVNGNGVVHNNCIGYFRGVGVYLSDFNTMVDGECVTVIVKKHSLGKMPKRGVLCEAQRLAGKKATAVYSDEIYALKMINGEGVVVLRNNIA
ncbi:hypothetical protein [Clostridium perfringens]|uniref:hypothetical protein n=1 Tax=Clostridium perfringens TaxID=1502 RepID=UPI001E53DB4C|nr:hypothetical protein [Clostridium perfringens]MCC5421373.1 hypothetical protein [Clostridium perfringens]MCC5430821.1 hypothetical protein [Clostridium perfringens]MCC5445303.1 hypothetical protein [Clostridium perfringens]MCC5448268.1 hypothetical protein [Clostridium perfringens]WVL77743.1 hypothetical protein LMS42_004895 [Clostridium perfringens]